MIYWEPVFRRESGDVTEVWQGKVDRAVVVVGDGGEGSRGVECQSG